MRGPDYRTVATMLRQDIERLAQQVLPDGKREGREWRGLGPDGAAWCVVLHGAKQGVFLNTGAGLAGDALELVRYGLCRGDRRAAYEWACGWLGIGEAVNAAVDTQAARLAAQANAARRAQAGERAGESARRNSLRIFLNARPFRWDDPPGRYLIGRGILPEHVPGTLRALRYYPDLGHPSGRYFAAMVAAVVNGVTGAHMAVHRTWVERESDGAWRKARVANPKMTLGSYLGGVIALTRGASEHTLPKAPPGDSCLIAEGIENALSLAGYYPERRALAAIAANNLAAVELPETIADVMLIDDRDGENDAVRDQRTAAHVQWEGEGRRVTRWRPPAGFKDANAYLTTAV
jgi:hypothetical protein